MENKKKVLSKNIKYSDQYKQKHKIETLNPLLKEAISKNKSQKIIDLGCGDGAFIKLIKNNFPKKEITGIDISPRRIKELTKKFPHGKFYLKDVCSTGLKETFDLVHCSQVIEHVEDDKKLVNEIERITKKRGYLFCSSVIKIPGAIYIYRNNGKFVLDPTHEREYRNSKQFLDLFKKDFSLIKYRIVPIYKRVLGFKFRLPGYYIIDSLWKKG